MYFFQFVKVSGYISDIDNIVSIANCTICKYETAYICWVYYLKLFFESSISMVLFLLHKLSQYTIDIASFDKLVHVLWVLISYF